MTFTFHTPWIPVVILGVVLGIVILGMLIRWKGVVRTLVSLVAVGGLITFIAIKILVPVSITVNDEGIFFDAYGDTAIFWSDIDEIAVIENLPDTEFDPRSRLRGTSTGKRRTGWFRLENGTRAKLLMEVRNSAVVIVRGDDTFLLAPADFETFVKEVSRHIDLE